MKDKNILIKAVELFFKNDFEEGRHLLLKIISGETELNAQDLYDNFVVYF